MFSEEEMKKYSFKVRKCPICKRPYVARFYEGGLIGSEDHCCGHVSEIISHEVKMEKEADREKG